MVTGGNKEGVSCQVLVLRKSKDIERKGRGGKTKVRKGRQKQRQMQGSLHYGLAKNAKPSVEMTKSIVRV
jgi:hypothetical protein